MERAARDVRLRHHTPFVIPLGASTPLGAAAFVAAISELADQIDPAGGAENSRRDAVLIDKQLS